MTKPANPARTEKAIDAGNAWRRLFYVNIGRLLIAAALVVIAISHSGDELISERNSGLFLFSACSWVLLSLFHLWSINAGRPEYHVQAYLQFTLDIIFITLLAHSSGGTLSIIGLLLVVLVVVCGLLFSRKMTLFFASLATLGVFAESAISSLLMDRDIQSTTTSGFFGLGLLAIGYLVSLTAVRIQQTEALAARRAADLNQLAKLNELIVDHLQTGATVLDGSGRITLINDQARDLFGLKQHSTPGRLDSISDQLLKHYRTWRDTFQQPRQAITLQKTDQAIKIQFVSTGKTSNADAVMFADDANQVDQQAQQLKLAALGRLSASVAHEIRNPVGAISHANQLLNESPAISDDDQELITIIDQQCKRIDAIIKSILKLGSPGSASPEMIDLAQWLPKFIELFSAAKGHPKKALIVQQIDFSVCMDVSHLYQVLTNLCDNAIRHYDGPPLYPLVRIRGGSLDAGRTAYLDIIDSGEGIPPEILDKVFEPFFTTGRGGTGLGLYLARELCDANNGGLEYVATPKTGHFFRLRFAPPEHCSQDLKNDIGDPGINY